MDATAPLWAPQELADYLGVPLATVYVWRTRGGGPPALKVGRHLRFRAEDVATWVRSRELDAGGSSGKEGRH